MSKRHTRAQVREAWIRNWLRWRHLYWVLGWGDERVWPWPPRTFGIAKKYSYSCGCEWHRERFATDRQKFYRRLDTHEDRKW